MQGQQNALGRARTRRAVEKQRAACQAQGGCYCVGFNGETCCFGPNGSRARPNGPTACLFCDQKRLSESFLDAAASLSLAKRFGRLEPFAREKALQRVQDPGFRAWLHGRGKFCQGLGGEPCVFGVGGAPARPNGPPRCLFCDEERLNAALAEQTKRGEVAKRFAYLGTAVRERALMRVASAEARLWLEDAAKPAAPEGRQPKLPRAAAGSTGKRTVGQPKKPGARSCRRGRAIESNDFQPLQRARYLVAAPDRSREDYRKVVVGDRKKSLNMMHQSKERLERGSEVNNRDPLPKANSSDLVAGLQLWREFNSWQSCRACKRLQPRELTLAGLEGPLSPWCAKGACVFCRNVRAAPVEAFPPDELRGLPAAVLEALRPVDANFGPYICSKDRFGRGNGYWSHSAISRQTSSFKLSARTPVGLRAKSRASPFSYPNVRAKSPNAKPQISSFRASVSPVFAPNPCAKRHSLCATSRAVLPPRVGGQGG